jgi:hypothetical protein
MLKFNEELVQAGAFIAIDGPHPSSTDARVACIGGKPDVTEGAFTEATAVISS